MIEEKKGTSYLDPKKIEEIFEIYRSVNENMMSVGGFPTQLADAFLVGCKIQGKICLFVHYYLHEEKKGILFEETDPLTPNNYGEKRREILESIESMGFIMNNLGFRNLPQGEKERILSTLKVFGNQEEPEASSKKDPETILILDEEPEKPAPSGKTSPLDPSLWGVFFRALASM